MSDIITINDTVKVKYKNTSGVSGVVRFIGEIPHKTGTYYGINLHSSLYNADRDDMAFFKRTQLHLLQQSNMIRVTVGDIVNITKYSSHGIVRFIGETKFKPDSIWYGIQLEQALGKNNGSVQGQKYFVCQPKYGIFVQSNHLELVKHKKIQSNKYKNKHKHKKSKKKTSSYSVKAKTDNITTTKNKTKTVKIEEITLNTQQSIDDDVKMAIQSMRETEEIEELNENNMIEMGILMHCEYKISISMGIYGYYYRTFLMPIQYQPSASTGIYGGYSVNYDVFQALFPMPQNYKPSYSTGIYGKYPIMDQPKMPNTYKPSYNTGIYGNYTVNDDAMVCKYINKEDLKYWTNRKPPPNMTIYHEMRKHKLSDDEIAEQMFKHKIAAYWINKFFIYGYVAYNM